MLAVLRDRAYARLFGAQVVALLGTGLLTVALGLLAFDMAGGQAGVVVGTAMSIKMLAYVAVSPVAAAVVARLPAKPVLIGADLVRAGVAVCLPLVSDVWQIYLLILVLQSASATFTPTFQALIPSVLPEEARYTRALALSRLAYDLESLLSPVAAAALLMVIPYNGLFVGTALGFGLSAVLVSVAPVPRIRPTTDDAFFERLTRGVRRFRDCGELRGLMGMNLVVATTTAMVVVNTVVIVRSELDRPEADVAMLLGAFGAGSMVIALAAPKLVEASSDLRIMSLGGLMLPPLLLFGATVLTVADGRSQWYLLVVLWLLLGAATSMVLTPSARLLRRNSTERSRSSVFAAQFSLSHACFLVTYPLAGLAGAVFGLPTVAMILVVLGSAGSLYALRKWRCY
ncbi:MFS transporter [Nesterenkonia marinintestina]|uniref:MFS transporter n=1 Tax=Nesterenkonia marinintestina TaxID=2979865 RepID=UPI0021BE03F5|nr:MFS transporter [Nesterenkonia sp. GX14115]